MICNADSMDISLLCTSQVHKREEGAAGACMNPKHLPQESIWNIHVPPQISLYMTPAAENEPYKWF